MTAFEQHLQVIAQEITINDEDRPVCTRDFEKIRDHLLHAMCNYSSVFQKLFSGTSLFGSYSNNVRINYPDEFDVIFKLEFPFGDEMIIWSDDERPGYVKLDFEDIFKALESSYRHRDVYGLLYNGPYELADRDNDFLRRNNLQQWLKDLITNALDYYGNIVRGCQYDSYELIYSKRGLAHTIFARCDEREISIDFIPAIVFGAVEWLEIRPNVPFKYKCHEWFAIPKPTGGPKRSRKYAFQICNPHVEHDLLLNKQNLKVVFRLLKSLRKKYEMKRLKSYFITTAFLWEIEEQEPEFWRNSTSYLLVHMVEVLCDYFTDGELPFFWDRDLNLLAVLSVDEINDYRDKLTRAYNTLSTYHHQQSLSFGRVLSHFMIPD